jgi:hypothetical protein
MSIERVIELSAEVRVLRQNIATLQGDIEEWQGQIAVARDRIAELRSSRDAKVAEIKSEAVDL